MFVGGSVKGVEWDICVPTHLNLKHVVVETASRFCVEVYFSNGRSVIAEQGAFHRHFDILPRGHVPNWKYVLMWMDTFREQRGISPRKGPPYSEKPRGEIERFAILDYVPKSSTMKKLYQDLYFGQEYKIGEGYFKSWVSAMPR
ncbi:hypothetical protein TNCV_2952941 [Trichonephila clavipes]|nr:hypothetical protein TNCV_2952941 [Trichonephila clavipes]